MIHPTGTCNKCHHEIEHGKCISCGNPDELVVPKDNINPSHYADMVIPPNEYITKNNLEWEIGNAIKYLSRYRNKNGIEDLNKAIKYIEMLKERKYENG